MLRRRPNPEHVRLLHGPYTPPPVKRGDKATCLFRDCDVIITSWSDARISWPRCRRIGIQGGSGLLVDEELARAVRCESLEMNSQNGDFLRLALKKTPDEVRTLQHAKWRSEVFGDFRVAALVSCIKAAYLTLFWKLGYSYTMSAAGISVGHDILGRFYLENHGKEKEAVQAAAVEFFRPYINMLRPVEIPGNEAPKGTIEDNRVFIWLGSSRRGLGIGVFIRVDKRLKCVLMPAYNDAEGAATYHDFLHNDKHELWVKEGQFNEATGAWDFIPQRICVLWPKTHRSFDLSRTPEDILALQPPPSATDAADSTANPPSPAGPLGKQSPA